MVLRAGYFAVALKLQEAATAMCHEDIRTRLSDCLNDTFRGTGNWAYVVAVFGDHKAGDVVYSCNSDLKKATYTMTAGATKIDTATAVDVQPLTTYEVESANLSEAGARNSKRDLSQLQTIHDSAIRLGANCSMAEAKKLPAGPLKLIESAACLETIILREAKADYEIKLIAPGKGSSAFYPAEVLKRDGPQVFKASTHVYLNHPTAAEEAARPEGDVTNLAGVLTTDAAYHESHAKGPGLYARMKVFADHAQMVEEKAAHVGMSIRASGVAEADGRLKDGLPVLKQLTGAESVDVVTRAGAGGMILQESAKAEIKNQESAMDEAAVQKLIESAVKAAQAPLLERAIRGDAREAAAKILAPLALIEKGKARVIDTILGRELPLKDGALDLVKFTEAVNAEAKAEGAYVAELSGSGQIRGMGITQPPQVLTEDARKLQEAETKRFEADTENVFGRLTNGNKAAAKNIAAREVAA